MTWSTATATRAATTSSDDSFGPTPAKNNARRIERKEREEIERREENLEYIPKPDEPIIKKGDLAEIKFEKDTYKDLKVKAGSNLDLQLLSQGLGLLNDFPDKQLSDPIAELLLLKSPPSFTKISELEPGRGDKITLIGNVCTDVKERRRSSATS